MVVKYTEGFLFSFYFKKIIGTIVAVVALILL